MFMFYWEIIHHNPVHYLGLFLKKPKIIKIVIIQGIWNCNGFFMETKEKHYFILQLKVPFFLSPILIWVEGLGCLTWTTEAL